MVVFISTFFLRFICICSLCFLPKLTIEIAVHSQSSSPSTSSSGATDAANVSVIQSKEGNPDVMPWGAQTRGNANGQQTTGGDGSVSGQDAQNIQDKPIVPMNKDEAGEKEEDGEREAVGYSF